MENKPIVLFVDDEPNILKSLRREFFDAPFSLLTAGSGQEGLDILAREWVDLVVSDVKMPEMDGISFLKTVSKRYPQISRVILSGYVEQTSVVNAIVMGVASSYLVKPWDSEELRNSIHQILSLRTHLSRPDILNTIQTIEQLPSLPTIYQDFLEAISLESPMRDLAAIISQDISLTARILQIANSAFYSSGKISSLERALIQLGTNIIKDIALTVSITSKMNWKPAQYRLLLEIFNHSTLVSRLTGELHQQITQQRLSESNSSAALTHDIGKIILLQYFPDQYMIVQKNVEINPDRTFSQEEEKLSCPRIGHGEIGAYFLRHWNLPDINVAAALHHHHPENYPREGLHLIHMIALANQLAPHLPIISERHWLEMTENMIFSPEQRKAFLKRAMEIQG